MLNKIAITTIFVYLGGAIHHVGNEIRLIDKGGEVIHVAMNDSASAKPSDIRPFPTGWTSYADWSNTGPPLIAHFQSTWIVPPAPATDHGQTVFLFNSLIPAIGTSILHPVPQWGSSVAGGNSSWAVANFCVSGTNAFFTPLVSIAVGQSLSDIMVIAANNTSYNFQSSFSDVGKPLQVNNIPNQFAPLSLSSATASPISPITQLVRLFSPIPISGRQGGRRQA